VLLVDAVHLAMDHGDATGMFENREGSRYKGLWRHFAMVMRTVSDRPCVCDVTEEAVLTFVESWTTKLQPAGIATKRLRLSALRALFRALRELHIASTDPSVDIVLPIRTTDQYRPFTTDEIELCRWNALATTARTRRPVVWATMEAGASTSEVGVVLVRHFDRASRELYLPGSPKTVPRTVPVNDWSYRQLCRRADLFPDDPDRPLAVPAPGDHDKARNSVTAVLRAVIRRSGFGPDPHVGPTSITSWLARTVLEETGQIEVVARRLGMRSLDRAARAAHWDWRAE